MKNFCLWLMVFLAAAAGLPAAEDDRPVVDAAKVAAEKAANEALPTFHIVGDSTVRSGGTGAGLWGWGERIKPFFDTNKINVVNHAIGGRSARTYFTEGRWQKVAEVIKPGDFVIIQFGHNDQGVIGDPANKQRADGKGLGDETVADKLPDGTVEQVHTFGWYMAQFASGAKARGATVILCAPVPHKQHWETGRDFASIADWDAQVAQAQGTLFLDLTLIVTDAYKQAGREKVETFFADKGTHTTDTGAQLNAACVVAGLKSLPGNPLAPFFSAAGRDIPAYAPAATNPAQTSLKFSFGTEPQAGWTPVAATNLYSAAAGYGFEPGTQVRTTHTFTDSEQPFYFSARLPEGNYRVSLTLGGSQDSVTTVKAELRRLMLEKVHAGPGQTETRTFIVNLRTPQISADRRVHLKPRELASEIWDWDDRLTLEFNGVHPSVARLSIEPADVPTVFLTGDSTVCDQPAEPWNSWGQMLPRFFKPEIAVANQAESGETVANSLRALRFEKVFSVMKPGDYLFVQFGHNDMKSQATNALAVYKSDLNALVERTRKLGATPVLVTSMERKNGLEQNTLGEYPQTVGGNGRAAAIPTASGAQGRRNSSCAPRPGHASRGCSAQPDGVASATPSTNALVAMAALRPFRRPA
jgi:lysophospholipase L1-like esterase